MLDAVIQWATMVLASRREVSAASADRLPTVAIVGAGFSGSLLAFHLTRLCAGQPVRVVLIERARRFAVGVAYSTDCGLHLLNVCAGKMSALPEQPNHFVEWLLASGIEANAQSFAQRKVYGAYLEDLLAQSQRCFPRLERLPEEAVALVPGRPGKRTLLELASGYTLEADRVVLAIGNAAPSHPVSGNLPFYDSPRYTRDPWAASALADLDELAPVLIVGSGLTMVDKLLELAQLGHRGTVFVLSRRGLLPQAHRPASSVCTLPDAWPTTALSLCRLLRQMAAESGDWRPAIDALRPESELLWQQLGRTEQRRFLRHLRPYWDVHRHRIAPTVAERLESLCTSDRIQRMAGRIESFDEDAGGVNVRYRPRGKVQTEVVRVERVINCTGPSCRLEHIGGPLMAGLRTAGLVRANAAGLGLDVDPCGALLDEQGVASESLFTIGTLRKGCLWETTAVPELRGQAADLARRLAESLVLKPVQAQTFCVWGR